MQLWAETDSYWNPRGADTCCALRAAHSPNKQGHKTGVPGIAVILPAATTIEDFGGQAHRVR